MFFLYRYTYVHFQGSSEYDEVPGLRLLIDFFSLKFKFSLKYNTRIYYIINNDYLKAEDIIVIFADRNIKQKYPNEATALTKG